MFRFLLNFKKINVFDLRGMTGWLTLTSREWANGRCLHKKLLIFTTAMYHNISPTRADFGCRKHRDVGCYSFICSYKTDT